MKTLKITFENVENNVNEVLQVMPLTDADFKYDVENIVDELLTTVMHHGDDVWRERVETRLKDFKVYIDNEYITDAELLLK